MQVPYDRQTNAPKYGRAGRVAGFGLIILAATTGGWLACQPGSLDCLEPECSDWKPKGTGGAAAGSGGTSGGMGGGMAGMGGGTPGGMGGGMAGPMPTAATPVPGCQAYPTLGDMDKFFMKSCGTSNLCHGKGAVWGELTTNVWMAALNRKAILTCGNAPLIDPVTPANSLIVVKTKDAVPKCPNGNAQIGTAMPPPDASQVVPAGAMKIPPLTPAEKACLDTFARVAAGK